MLSKGDPFSPKNPYNNLHELKERESGLANSENKDLTPKEWNSITQHLLKLSAQIGAFTKNK